MNMGFHTKLVLLIMQCVKSASFLVLVNGEPKGRILPSCGIRQGDPLSPYLFFLCTEGLVSLLRKVASSPNLRGISVCKGAPTINHLLFADGSLIFYKSNNTSY